MIRVGRDDPLILADLSMAALFELVEAEMAATLLLSGEASAKSSTMTAAAMAAPPFTETLLRLFETHLLPTHNICHLQYLIFYVAGKTLPS
jgi:hypothetical protein